MYHQVRRIDPQFPYLYLWFCGHARDNWNAYYTINGTEQSVFNGCVWQVGLANIYRGLNLHNISMCAVSTGRDVRDLEAILLIAKSQLLQEWISCIDFFVSAFCMFNFYPRCSVLMIIAISVKTAGLRSPLDFFFFFLLGGEQHFYFAVVVQGFRIFETTIEKKIDQYLRRNFTQQQTTSCP